MYIVLKTEVQVNQDFANMSTKMSSSFLQLTCTRPLRILFIHYKIVSLLILNKIIFLMKLIKNGMPIIRFSKFL